jgi:hypothetical protein
MISHSSSTIPAPVVYVSLVSAKRVLNLEEQFGNRVTGTRRTGSTRPATRESFCEKAFDAIADRYLSPAGRVWMVVENLPDLVEYGAAFHLRQHGHVADRGEAPYHYGWRADMLVEEPGAIKPGEAGDSPGSGGARLIMVSPWGVLLHSIHDRPHRIDPVNGSIASIPEQGDPSARPEHAAELGVCGRAVEPVEGLGDGHRVDGAGS